MYKVDFDRYKINNHLNKRDIYNNIYTDFYNINQRNEFEKDHN